jgi:hypothetical protein
MNWMRNLLEKAKNLHLSAERKWLLVKILDISLATLSQPLSFYVALSFDGGLSFAFLVSLLVLMLCTGVGVLITWHVWQILKAKT